MLYGALEAGGTKMVLAVSDERLNMLDRLTLPTKTPSETMPAMIDFFRERRVDALGVGTFGPVNLHADSPDYGTITATPKLAWRGYPLLRAFREALHIPCAIDTDVNAAALGEWFAGRGRGCDHLLMVTLGTGVGGGIVEHGRVLGGARGIAGELGHFTLYQDGAPCPCGKRGCFESYASTTALVRAAQERFSAPALDGRAIFARAAAGDPAMQSLLDGWIGDIAAGLSGLVHIFNPELVLIGGGVSAQERLLIDPLRERVLTQVMPRFAEGLRIERAQLGNDAGLIGAARFLLDRCPHLAR